MAISFYVAIATRLIKIQIMKDIYPLLHKCSFFNNVPETHYEETLNYLNAKRKLFTKDESVLNIGDEKRPTGFVLKGNLEISILDEESREINVTHINEGNVFGMAIALSGNMKSPIRLKALKDSDILFLDFTPLLNLNPSIDNKESIKYKDVIYINLLRDLARQTVFLNHKIRIIGQKKLRDKIKIFLASLPLTKENVIHIPYNRNELSDYLYADRSALSREISHMKDEGILEMNGNDVHILNPSFLKS